MLRSIINRLLPSKKFILWLAFDFSGIRAIYEKILPPSEEKKAGNYRTPPTFSLWIIGIYIAFFGVASQRYEHSINKLEAKSNAIIASLSSIEWKLAITRIPAIQNTLIPTPPNLINPSSVFKTIFGKREKDPVIIDLLKDIIKDKKEHLAGINLNYVVLDELDLSGADFSGAYLVGASFIGADLSGATFKDAYLSDSNLTGAIILGVSFENAACIKTDFTNIKIRENPEVVVEGEDGGSTYNLEKSRARRDYIKKWRICRLLVDPVFFIMN